MCEVTHFIPPAYEDGTYIIQTPGNYPKENIIYSEQVESLKSRITKLYFCVLVRCSVLRSKMTCMVEIDERTQIITLLSSLTDP